MIQFPHDFLWGAATSAYQVEGDNSNSDWWHWEKRTGKENSGRACRHYEFYEQDFDLAKNLNQNAHRFSVEWSRIEPQEGKFSAQEITHYMNVILALRARNIEPIVTLQHFTIPQWLSEKGGWCNANAAKYFLRYCEFVVKFLAKHVRFWVTINEPNVFVYHAYILGAWPPQKKSYIKAKIAEDNLLSAHVKAYRLIRDIYKKSGLFDPCIGIAQNVQAFVPCTDTLKNKFASYIRDTWYNFGFLDKIMRQRSMDFVGVNYYSRQLVEAENWSFWAIATGVCKSNHHAVKKNSLGWDIYPEGLYKLLLKFKKYALPVIITENGICTSDDSLRWDYIKAHLENVYLAIKNGVTVTGYLYWSLMDNFEWDKGFSPRFGLVEVDYNNYRRAVRDSARKFAQVCKTGILE